MATKTVRVRLERVGTVAFEATGEASGGTMILDGSADIGGEGRGMRPMEILLTSLASCAAMDVVHILRKQRQPLETLRIEAEGDRADATPAPYTHVRFLFVGNRGLDEHKLRRAVSLGVEKYCSAITSLDPAIEVTWEARLEDEA